MDELVADGPRSKHASSYLFNFSGECGTQRPPGKSEREIGSFFLLLTVPFLAYYFAGICGRQP